MRKLFLFLLLSTFVVSCGPSDNTNPDTNKDEVGGGTEGGGTEGGGTEGGGTEGGGTEGGGTEGGGATGDVTVYMEADGVTDTYTLLNKHGYYEEVPDCGHPVKHITQVMDETLKKYVFKFDLHVENGIVDTDRCLADKADRQRNEIKTYSKSPVTMVANKGQKHTYKWKFCLTEDHLPSGSFTHIHQIKASGGDDDSMPLITVTTRYGSGNNHKLQVIYVPPKDSDDEPGNHYLVDVPLKDFLGEWVEVTEQYYSKTDGGYSIKFVRVRDQKQLASKVAKLDLWRTGASFNRPKFGMYRKVYTDDTQAQMLNIQDESIYFTDFTLIEHKD